MCHKIVPSLKPLLIFFVGNWVLFCSFQASAQWQTTPADRIMRGAKIYKQNLYESLVKEQPGVLGDSPYNPQALLTSKCQDFKGKVDLSQQVCFLNRKSFFFIVKTNRDLKYGFRYVFVEPYKSPDAEIQNQLIAHLRSK